MFCTGGDTGGGSPTESVMQTERRVFGGLSSHIERKPKVEAMFSLEGSNEELMFNN